MIFRVAKVDAASGHGMTQFGRALAEINVVGRVHAIDLPVSGAETYAASVPAGLSLIRAPSYKFGEDFRRRALVRVLTEVPPSPLPVFVNYPRAKHLSPRLRVFIDWMAEWFRAEGVGS